MRTLQSGYGVAIETTAYSAHCIQCGRSIGEAERPGNKLDRKEVERVATEHVRAQNHTIELRCEYQLSPLPGRAGKKTAAKL